MPYECELLDRPAQAALVSRAVTPVSELPAVLGRAYGAIAQYMAESGVDPAGPPFVAYYNVDMQALDIEAGFPVARRVPGRGEIEASEIPGGRSAACMHVGPYDEVGPAYQALSRWIAEHAFTPTGVAYEYFLDDPAEVRPAELRTQVVMPLRD